MQELGEEMWISSDTLLNIGDAQKHKIHKEQFLA